MQELLIEKIRTDSGVQSRERISDEYVAELAELIKTGKKLPPIDVYSDGTDVWAADGFHRIHAHLKANRRTIRCNVHKGSIKDAIWASVAANQEHGLRRTNADKRHAVEMALKTRPELTDRALAEHVGVSDPFVSGLRRQVLTVSTCERVGRDGKTYKVPPPPTPPQQVTPKTPPPPSDSIPSRPFDPAQGKSPGPRTTPPPPFDSAQGRPVPRPAVRVDDLKKPIPDHLIPLFDRASEVQALLGQISSIKGVLKRAQESDDPLFGDCHFQAAEAALQTAFTEIKATKPFAVCPWCHGTLSENCRGCGQRGVIGEFRWNQSVPPELKK